MKKNAWQMWMLIIIFTSNCTFLVSIEPQALAESDPVQSKYEPWLWKKLSELEANGTTRFMTIGVGVNCTPFKHNETAAYCFKTQVANLLFQEHNATILYVGKVLSFINIKIKNSEIKKIAAYEFIDGLADGERKGKLCLDVSTTVVRSKFVNERLGYNGAGINISVLDSGIDPNHPDLANKNIVWRDFVNGQLSPYDDYGHGTHCAGVIAGTGINSPDLKYRGAASGVNRLIIGKLGDQWGNIPNETIARTALDWAISEGAQVISCSWGFWSYEEGVCNGKCELCRKADECVQKGAVVVCAAGNRGPSSQTIECPGTAFDVITVGNVDDHNMELRHVTLRDGSSRGPTYDGRIKPDVVAPGTCIISCRAHNTDIRTPADSYIDSLYVECTGTSFAAPHVAGVAALILQAHPKWVPTMVKYAIMATANLNDYLSPLSGNDRGTGIVDAARAISCFTEIPPDQADGKYENDWGNADAIAYLNGIFRIWAAGTVGRDARAEARLNKTFTPSRSMSETTFFFGFHDVGYMESDLGYAQFYATLKLWQGNTILASTEKEIHHVDWGGAYGANDYYTINITYQGTLLTGQQYKLEYGFYTFAHVAWSNFYDTPKNITALHLTAIDTVGAGNPNFEDRGGSVYWPWYWANNRAGRRELGGDCYPQSGDGTVDIFDLNTITNSYGSRPGQPKWNPNADLDGDNNVGLSDLIIVATDFGKVTNRKDGFYSWYTNVDGGGGNYTLAQWLCDHDVNNMKGKQVTFTFWFMPETVAPNGLQNYARAELYYITDTGSSQTINGAWVYPTQVKWYSASITTTTTLPANTKAIKVKIRGQPDFKAWIDKTSITIT